MSLRVALNRSLNFLVSAISHRSLLLAGRSIHVFADPENRGNKQDGVNFDTLGTWNNRIQMDLNMEESIRQGTPVPQVKSDSVGHATLLGRRKENEDRYVIERLDVGEGIDLLYIGVFDGHGGAVAAEFTSKHLHHHILYWWREGVKDMELILRQAFIDVNNAYARHVISNNIVDGELSGTTATVCLIRNSVEVSVGHVGDSRCAICRRGTVKRLTTDHTPHCVHEADRLSKLGTIVTSNSVGVSLVQGRLAMTRSIGDLELKPYGVTSVPQTRSIKIKHGVDAFLALTSDGINFVMSDEEIVSTINRCENPSEAAHFLADQALQFGSDDNATALVVPFGAWGKYTTPLTSLHSGGFIRWSSFHRG